MAKPLDYERVSKPPESRGRWAAFYIGTMIGVMAVVPSLFFGFIIAFGRADDGPLPFIFPASYTFNPARYPGPHAAWEKALAWVLLLGQLPLEGGLISLLATRRPRWHALVVPAAHLAAGAAICAWR